MVVDSSSSFGSCNDPHCGCGDADADRESNMEHAYDEQQEVDFFYHDLNPEWAHYALWAADESVGVESRGSAFSEVRQRDRDWYMSMSSAHMCGLPLTRR